MEKNTLESLLERSAISQPYCTTDLMNYPWLLPDVFDWRSGYCSVDTLLMYLQSYTEQALKSIGPEKLADLVTKRSFDSRNYPDGLMGRDRIMEVKERLDNRGECEIVVGLTGAKLHLQRVGRCLALQCTDVRDQPHLQADTDIAIVRQIRPFIQAHCYHSRVDRTFEPAPMFAALAKETELKIADGGLETLPHDMIKRFKAQGTATVTSGTIFGIPLFVSLVYMRDNKQVSDAEARGMVECVSETSITFQVTGGSGEGPQVRYLLCTNADQYLRKVDHAIDIENEQEALTEATLEIGMWLYRRERAQLLPSNPHILRFMPKESGEVA